MNQIIILGVVLMLLLITFLFSRKEQVSKAESDKESRKTKRVLVPGKGYGIR